MTTRLLPDPRVDTPSAPEGSQSLCGQAEDAAQSIDRQLAQLQELSGFRFRAVEAQTGLPFAPAQQDDLDLLNSEATSWFPTVAGASVLELPSGLLFGAVHLPADAGKPLLAVTVALSHREPVPSPIVLAAAEAGWSNEKLDEWLERQPVLAADTFRRILSLLDEHLRRDESESQLLDEIDGLTAQIEHTYEEITLLHSLTQHLQISRSPRELAALCLDRMHPLMRAEGSAIWLEERDEQSHLLVAGEIPLDEYGLARLTAHFEEPARSHPCVRNHISRTQLGKLFPGLDSIVLAPIAEGRHRSGWIVSCNARHGHEFGTVEASLVSSVATILGTHLRNLDLYRQHEELLLAFVRSLVSTLDAKDPYTRGHSERVALVARRIGEELGLPPKELQSLYLAGLLHDIGKIGIDDRILRKPGALTDEEFAKVREHPMVGYEILAGLRNLQHVIPGVRHHHECYDGNGYPDRLAGDQIPLMARILAVADAHDAMGSDRPYRAGLSQDRIDEIFRRGAGKQWDRAVVDAYFAAKDEILRICREYSPERHSLLATQTEGPDNYDPQI